MSITPDRPHPLFHWLISLGVHLLLFTIFAGLDVVEDHGHSTTIEFVTLTPGTGKNSVESQHRGLDKKPQAKVSNPSKQDANLVGQKHERVTESGESDLRSDSGAGREPHNAVEAYLAHVRQHIEMQNYYPAASRSLGEEGLVVIRLTLSRNGSIEKIELIDGCPYRRLNDAAMKAAARAGPFGAFPGEINFNEWKITLPIRFDLSAG